MAESPRTAAYLGLAATTGRFGRKDLAEARRRFNQACDGGDAEGCYGLALMLSAGLATPKDKAEALGALKKACAGGHPKACAEVKRLDR